MDDTWKIDKKLFLLIAVSVVVAALLLRLKMPDMEPMVKILSAAFTDAFSARVIMFAGVFGAWIFVFFMPLSAFFIYWCSMVFAGYYLLALPVEAVPLFAIAAFPCLLNRFQKVQFLEARINLVIIFTGIILFGVFSAVINKYIIDYPVVKLFLLLPAFHILGMSPGAGAKSRFRADEVQVVSELSAAQKKQMAGLAELGWWEIIRPQVESTLYNIIFLFDSFSDIKMFASKEKEAPRTQTKSQGTRLKSALAKLKSRDEKFDEKAFVARAKKAFMAVQKACYSHAVEKVQAFISDALFEQFKCRAREQTEAGIIYKYDSVTDLEMTIDHVFHDNSFDEIQVLVMANVRESMTDAKTGAVIADAKVRKIHEYWSFIRRPAAKTLEKPGLLEGNCPNCGADLVIGQATRCRACESYIRSGFYDWVLAKITQGCEWSYSDPSLVPAWDELKKRDLDFTIHQIEDLAGVIFWNLRLAERQKSAEPALRFAVAAFSEKLKAMLEQKNLQFHRYWENIAIASVTLRGIKCSEDRDRIYVLVVWSGVPVRVGADGKVAERIRYSKPVRDVMVLSRDSQEKTNQNNALSSSHCPGCGAALATHFALHCGYCGSSLNSGKEWQLENLLKENDPDYMAILHKKAEIVSQNYARRAAKAEEKREQESREVEIRSGRDIITTMAQILLADGKIDEAEMNFIKDMALKFHMPDEILEGIIAAVKENETYIPKPVNAREALDILQGAAEMAYADGFLAEEEEKALLEVAKQLGYSAVDLKRIIRNAEKVMMRKKRR